MASSSALANAPVSASAILEDLSAEKPRDVKLATGVETIDTLLGGGLERGKVTELWGPPGSARTSLALGIAQRSVSDGARVTWFSCAHPLSEVRIAKLGGDAFHQIYPPSLAHLISVMQAPSCFLPSTGQDLLVLDDLSSMMDLEYPRQMAYTTSSDSEMRKWQASRRSAVLGTIVMLLNQIAVSYNIAVIVLNGCATTSRSRSGQSAILVSAIGGLEWEAGIWYKIALFRDFNGRFAALQRSRGSNMPASSFIDSLAHFAVDQDGRAVDAAKAMPAEAPKPQVVIRSAKRKLEEIADSDGELDEYGWNADEELEVQVIE